MDVNHHVIAVVIVFDSIADMIHLDMDNVIHPWMGVTFELFITLLATTFNFNAALQFDFI